MEIRLKESTVRNYKFTNKKYSKMFYNGEEKEIRLETEALYKVYTSKTGAVRVDFTENSITSDDPLSILLNECNEMFRIIIFETDNTGKIQRVMNKEKILERIKIFRNENPEKYKLQIEKDVLISISEAYEEALKVPNFEERFLDAGVIGMMFSGIYGDYGESSRRIRRELRNMFSIPLAVEIHQDATRHLSSNEIKLRVNGNLDGVYLREFEIHEIMKNQLGYDKQEIKLSYSGDYTLELDTGFVKTADLITRFQYGDNYTIQLNSEMIQYE